MASIIKREWVDTKGETQLRYDAYVTKRGHRKQVKTFKREAMALRWVRLIEAEFEMGAFKSTAIAERMTLREAMQRYIIEVIPSKKSQAAERSNRNIVEPHLGSYPLISLDNQVLAAYRDKRLRTKATSARRFKDGRVERVDLGYCVSKGSVRHELSFISRVITHAMREWGVHLPAGNPVRLVKMPAQGKPRDRRLSADEETRLLDLFDHAHDRTRCRNPYMRSVMIFAIETAARRGEIVRLRWEDVDLKARTALFRDTKNSEDRRIGLSTRAVGALMAIPRTRDGRVFPISTNALRLAWARALRHLGIEGLHFHDLRHEGTSRLAVKLNGDIMAMSAMTGHKSLQMLKRYTHLRAEELARRLG